MTRYLGLGALTASLAAVFSAPASAAFVIDDFTQATGGMTVISRTTLGTTSTTNTGPTTNIVGGVREWSLQQTATFLGSEAKGEILTGSGVVRVSNDAGSDSTVTFFYDGNAGGMGDLNADFTAGGTLDTIRFGVLFDDLGFNIRVTVFDGTNTVMVMKPAPIVNPVNPAGVPVDFKFSDFAGIDFTSVNTFQVQLDSLNSADYIIDYIVTTTAVPEPASLGLVAAGVVAVGGFARRKFAKKA